LAALFRAAVAVRNALYDAGVLRAVDLGIPAVSVGNLTVGGTGKTPVANWLARELAARGAKPAILLRGYGRDETLVHERLAPEAVVIAHADRVAAAGRARESGCDVVVLDDAFQHRAAARIADVVLVSADERRAPRWPLPAGPWREPMTALRRAHLALVTAKAAGADDIDSALRDVRRAAPGVALGVVRLAPDTLVQWDTGALQSTTTLAGKRVLAVSAVGDPESFEAQLRAAGAAVTSIRFRDHHTYTAADAGALAARANPVDSVVCTLKDAVKLGPLWPPGASALWYLSQRVTIERGTDFLDGLIAQLLTARTSARAR
jgi:tetraacyldisaccharide 4'-kinase